MEWNKNPWDNNINNNNREAFLYMSTNKSQVFLHKVFINYKK